MGILFTTAFLEVQKERKRVRMFQTGDYVVYGANGVCKVEAVGKLSGMLADGKKVYYTLIPVDERGGKVFTPVDNQKVIMRPVVSREDACYWLDHIGELENIEIVDERRKETIYKETLSKCDYREWIRMVKTLHNRKLDRLAHGKKVTASDERFFHLVESNLFGELSVSLGISREEVREFVKTRMEKA